MKHHVCSDGAIEEPEANFFRTQISQPKVFFAYSFVLLVIALFDLLFEHKNY